ncbi:hypothetical protein ACFWWC_20265 [Streptomyces sp. NPDC058642]|uniref:ATP-dependent DNA ligase n=1 Tax=Streptomyces sp. NPDC058642 TaxID=3346572 RepID=UPI00364E191D
MKWDGYRPLVGQWADGRVAIRNRNGSDLARAFPELEAAVRRQPDDTALDGELIVRDRPRPPCCRRAPIGLPFWVIIRPARWTGSACPAERGLAHGGLDAAEDQLLELFGPGE